MATNTSRWFVDLVVRNRKWLQLHRRPIASSRQARGAGTMPERPCREGHAGNGNDKHEKLVFQRFHRNLARARKELLTFLSGGSKQVSSQLLCICASAGPSRWRWCPGSALRLQDSCHLVPGQRPGP